MKLTVYQLVMDQTIILEKVKVIAFSVKMKITKSTLQEKETIPFS